MNIGFISTRLAGVDGVSLETQKLAKVFREMGHDCFFCAGELDGNAQPSYLIPEAHFTHPTAKALHDEAFAKTKISAGIFSHASMLLPIVFVRNWKNLSKNIVST